METFVKEICTKDNVRQFISPDEKRLLVRLFMGQHLGPLLFLLGLGGQTTGTNCKNVCKRDQICRGPKGITKLINELASSKHMARAMGNWKSYLRTHEVSGSTTNEWISVCLVHIFLYPKTRRMLWLSDHMLLLCRGCGSGSCKRN